MQTQRFFKLRDRARNVAFAHENFSQVIMRLSELWIEFGCRLKMLLCSCQVACCQERTPEIYSSIDQAGIGADRLAILCSSLIQCAVFFQKGAITMVGLRRFRRQADCCFAFRRSLVILT
jgi:hypothetical protein